MKQIENVLIAGAGAVGLTLAHQLYCHNPQCLSILADGERLERYRQKGIFVNGKKIPFQLLDAAQKPPANKMPDLVILACKNHHLKMILGDLKNYIGPTTLMLSLLNGITSEEIIAAKYGKERIPLAMIIGLDSQYGSEGAEYKFSGTIFFGEDRNPSKEGKPTAECSLRVRLIADFFERSGITYSVPENMLRTLWYKFMMNVGINQASAVLRLPYGPFQTDGRPDNVPEARTLMDAAMQEVIALSKAEGINLDSADIQNCHNTLRPLTPASKTSMCQDVLAGRKTEVELFAKTVSDLGKKHGIPTPVNDILYLQLRTIEQSYAYTIGNMA